LTPCEPTGVCCPPDRVDRRPPVGTSGVSLRQVLAVDAVREGRAHQSPSRPPPSPRVEVGDRDQNTTHVPLHLNVDGISVVEGYTVVERVPNNTLYKNNRWTKFKGSTINMF